MVRLLEHHEEYLEIHGQDKTKWMTYGEHKRLHVRLRKEGKCNVPVNVLQKIASKACSRTNKCIQKKIKYRIINKQHEINYSTKYMQNNTQSIKFTTPMGLNVRLREILVYNFKTGNIVILSAFEANNKHNLYELTEKEPMPIVADKALDVGV